MTIVLVRRCPPHKDDSAERSRALTARSSAIWTALTLSAAYHAVGHAAAPLVKSADRLARPGLES